jgi:hypothetical protein
VTATGTPPPAALDHLRPIPERPVLVDVVAALFVFGGLFGLSQLLVGDFVITGSLPAKMPIVGVATFLYVASVAIGVLVRMGRYWFPAINLAVIFVIGYLPAFARPVALGLGLAYGGAALALAREHRWFGLMKAWRADPWAARPAKPAAGSAAQRSARSTKPARSSRPGAGRRRPSGSR